MPSIPHSIILGGGIGGLSAAVLLAKAGRRVTLIECQNRLGGRLRRFWRDGIPFDTGLHFTSSLDGVLGQALVCLGVQDDIHHESFPWSLQFSNGRKLSFPNTGRSAFYDYLAQEFPKDIQALRNYQRRETEVLRNTPMFDLRDAPGDPVKLDDDADQITLADFFQQCGIHGDLATALGAPALYHGALPGEVPAARHFRISYGFEEQMQRLERGGDTLCENFEHVLAQLGVEVRLNTRVIALRDFAAGPIAREALLSDGTILPFDDLFTSLHPAEMPSMLPEERRPRFQRILNAVEDTCGFFTVFATVDDGLSLPPGLCSVLRDNDLDRVLSPVEKLPGLSTGFSLTHERDADGVLRQCLILLVPAAAPPACAAPSPEAKQAMLDAVMQQACRAMPCLEGHIRVHAAATPHTYARYIPPGRGAYGVRMKVDNPRLMGRLPIRNLYAIGESAFAPGVLGTLLTSFLTVRRVIGEERYQAILPPDAFLPRYQNILD